MATCPFSGHVGSIEINLVILFKLLNGYSKKLFGQSQDFSTFRVDPVKPPQKKRKQSQQQSQGNQNHPTRFAEGPEGALLPLVTATSRFLPYTE